MAIGMENPKDASSDAGATSVKGTGFLTQVGGLVSAKLSLCPRCMGMATLGTVVGWVLVALLCLAWPNPVALAGSATFAAAFTLLMVGHAAAITVRQAQERGRPAQLRAARGRE